ncbi:hypothetical protein QTO34_020229 [Cnephaeus nilssonii]|uniref:asparaginase n=1 Tax=Cnephaeus nilssonii TaxID=3371016 RepID=A0AA40HYW6_CNENI|nr:hypothetical protein QTO34_020229 [Eptesicus nilssonii]
MARAAGPERRLLAIYTGGTIGMRSQRGVLVPGRGLAAVLRTLPMFHDEEHARARGLPEDTLVLPPASPDQRIVYTVLECQPLFDSSDMTITEWVQIAQTIETHYERFHGFVVIHGTDTMAFAAAALAFALENLQKTVVLTGAQVCLFFQNQLFRGTRVTKVDACKFAAFCSPNLPPLAVLGADVTKAPQAQEAVREGAGCSGLPRRVPGGRPAPGPPAPDPPALAQLPSGSQAGPAAQPAPRGHRGQSWRCRGLQTGDPSLCMAARGARPKHLPLHPQGWDPVTHPGVGRGWAHIGPLRLWGESDGGCLSPAVRGPGDSFIHSLTRSFTLSAVAGQVPGRGGEAVGLRRPPPFSRGPGQQTAGILLLGPVCCASSPSHLLFLGLKCLSSPTAYAAAAQTGLHPWGSSSPRALCPGPGTRQGIRGPGGRGGSGLWKCRGGAGSTKGRRSWARVLARRRLPGPPAPLSPVNRELVRKARGEARLAVHSGMERDVGLLRLYPGIPATLVRAFLQPPLKGVVMETFGSGNGPTKPDLLRELRAAAARGLLILNCTHCLQGTVTSDYAAGMAAAGAGIISGFDMTSEAPWPSCPMDLRGEMTLPEADTSRPSPQSSLGLGVAQLLSLSQEMDAVRDALTPSLACAAAHAGDLEALQALAERGSDLSLEDFQGQTPLHVAARRGHAAVVSLLLRSGAAVNARDQEGLSPLLLAVRGRLASRADGEGLRAWWQAGADLGQPGYDGRSALLVAEAAGNVEVVTLLQSLQGVAGAPAPGPVSPPKQG